MTHRTPDSKTEEEIVHFYGHWSGRLWEFAGGEVKAARERLGGLEEDWRMINNIENLENFVPEEKPDVTLFFDDKGECSVIHKHHYPDDGRQPNMAARLGRPLGVKG